MATTPAIAARTGFDPGDFPVAESAHVAALPPDARLYAPDKYGGYLIYRFRGSRPVFFDGRSDFYGAAFLRRYIRLAEARPGWSALVREYGFTHALLAKDAPLGAALEAAGWRRLAAGNAALLLEAPSKAAP